MSREISNAILQMTAVAGVPPLALVERMPNIGLTCDLYGESD
jgi:hypothetical protein